MSDDEYSKPLTHGCEFDATNSRYTKKLSCKPFRGLVNKNNDQIFKALTKGSNLLIESTGSYYPPWLLDDF